MRPYSNNNYESPCVKVSILLIINGLFFLCYTIYIARTPSIFKFPIGTVYFQRLK